jgi:hypothetical protein
VHTLMLGFVRVASVGLVITLVGFSGGQQRVAAGPLDADPPNLIPTTNVCVSYFEDQTFHGAEVRPPEVVAYRVLNPKRDAFLKLPGQALKKVELLGVSDAPALPDHCGWLV